MRQRFIIPFRPPSLNELIENNRQSPRQRFIIPFRPPSLNELIENNRQSP